MPRNPQNTNLHLHYDDTYHGLPVQKAHAPLTVEYLDALYLTVQRALHEHPRSFAFRVDLRLPANLDASPYLESNVVIERFIESFKAKIRHNRMRSMRQYDRVHDTSVRYVWAREVGYRGRPHFHLVIFLNNDAFFSLGNYEPGRNNIFNRLNEAWASALRLPVDSVMGLAECPENACYYLRRDDPESVADLFCRASYLCKAATKSYGNGCHGFGASRR